MRGNYPASKTQHYANLPNDSTYLNTQGCVVTASNPPVGRQPGQHELPAGISGRLFILSQNTDYKDRCWQRFPSASRQHPSRPCASHLQHSMGFSSASHLARKSLKQEVPDHGNTISLAVCWSGGSLSAESVIFSQEKPVATTRRSSTMTSLRGILVLFFLCAMSFSQSAKAQPPDEGPALGVARLSLAKGDVAVQRGESGDSIQATANMALVEADILTTGLASRSEIQLDHSNFLRLNEYSAVRLANLGHRAFRIQLERGIVTYSELRGGDADVDIETPLAAVRPEKNGRYRIEVVGLDKVTIAVQKGRAEVASANGKETLKAGQRMIVRKADQGIEFQVAKADPKDDWDLWNLRRDRQLMQSKAYSYVNTSIYGAEELDDYGHWVYVPNYGRCWFPSVTVGWAPYRHGRWSWLDYYGWTWVSHDPWGWAPYHYGRWIRHARHGWGWYPGSYYSRHHWQPALVAFFGYDGRPGLRVGFGSRFGYYGWIALAPGDPYYPWYGRRSHHRRGLGRGGSTILVDNRTNIYNNYRNARHRNGTTLVAARHFSRGQILNVRSLQASEVREASLMRGRIPVVPDRASQGQLLHRSRRLTQGREPTPRARFFSTGRSRRNVARNSFVQQRQEMVRFVDSLGRSDSQPLRPATSRSSTTPRTGRSAPNLRSQGTTGARSTVGSTNRRSLASPSTPAAGRGRGNVDRTLRGPVTSPPPPVARPPSGSRSDSPGRSRRFDRRQATGRTVTPGTPARSSIPPAAESVSESSPSVPSVPPVRPSPRFVPRSSPRVNSSRQQSSPSYSRPSPSASRSSSRSSSRVSAPSPPSVPSVPPVQPSPRFVPRSSSRVDSSRGQSSPSNSRPSRSVSRPSSRSSSRVSTPSRPSPSRSPSRVRSSPGRSRPSPSVSRSSSRSSSRVSTPSRPSPSRSPSRVRSSPSRSRPSPSASRSSSRSSSRASTPSRSKSSSSNRSSKSRSSSRSQSRSRSQRR